MVSPEPDVLVIDRNQEDNYLIFACDGIWDAIPEPQECVNIVSDLLVILSVRCYLGIVCLCGSGTSGSF